MPAQKIITGRVMATCARLSASSRHTGAQIRVAPASYRGTRMETYPPSAGSGPYAMMKTTMKLESDAAIASSRAHKAPESFGRTINGHKWTRFGHKKVSTRTSCPAVARVCQQLACVRLMPWTQCQMPQGLTSYKLLRLQKLRPFFESKVT